MAARLIYRIYPKLNRPSCSFVFRGRVELIDEQAVLLINHAPLDLERRRQLAAINRELVGQERDAPDALVVVEARGQCRHFALHETDNRRVAAERSTVALRLARVAVLGERALQRLPVR